MNSAGGTVISRPLYHITFRSRLPSILERGLLPARDLKPLGFEQPYPSDDGYVYLFNEARMRRNIAGSVARPCEDWFQDKELLEVRLPPEHPLEKEYEQATLPLRLSGDALEWFLAGRRNRPEGAIDSADDYVRHYFRKTHDKEYAGAMTAMAVREFIDSHISDREWGKNDGSYRTPMAVAPEHVMVVTLHGLTTG